eukprot:3646129-Prorocentrum_lima.AAC.1
MTSSLVGSEMCIRDRRATFGGLGAICPKLTTRALKETYSSHSPVTSLPVSYTHLTLPTICSV